MEISRFYLIYCAYDGIITQSAFDSQVVNPLALLQTIQHVDITLVAFEQFLSFFLNYWVLLKKKQRIIRQYGLRVFFLPRLPGYWGLKLTAFLSKVIGKRVLFKIWKQSPVIFKGRGLKSAYIGCRLRQAFPNLKVIYDARAKEPEQYAYSALEGERVIIERLSLRQRMNYLSMQRIEQNLVAKVDAIFCVSEALKREYILMGYRPDKIFVIPNGVDTTQFYFSSELRKQMRKQLGIEDTFCFVYSGSMHTSQNPETMVQLFKTVVALDPTSYFLGLTVQPEVLNKLLHQYDIPRDKYLVVKKDHTEIGKYLNVADVGIMFREKNIYNRTSYPVKFWEYLACGLYTVISDGVDDIVPLATKFGLGEIVDDFSEAALRRMAMHLVQLKSKIQAPDQKQRIAEIALHYADQKDLTLKRLQYYFRVLNIALDKNSGKSHKIASFIGNLKQIE